MAAYLQSRGIASFGKRFLNQINGGAVSRDSSISPSLLLRRAVHGSVYEKNPEENVRPTVVPDHVIESDSEKYWAPHPQTGVFGPPGDQNQNPAAGERGIHTSAGEDSILEQKAFFRALEDLDFEKSPPQA